MHDGRVPLVIVISFLYLAQGLLGNWISGYFKTPATPAYLRSVSPGILVVEADPIQGHRDAVQALAAVHAPFFFQAIPINSAEKEMLMTVKGIGPSLADSIISYRRRFGPFGSIEDLTKVNGVGTKRAASLAPFLQFDEVP